MDWAKSFDTLRLLLQYSYPSPTRLSIQFGIGCLLQLCMVRLLMVPECYKMRNRSTPSTQHTDIA